MFQPGRFKSNLKNLCGSKLYEKLSNCKWNFGHRKPDCPSVVFKNRPLQDNAPEAHKSGSLILRTSVIIRAGTRLLVVCGKYMAASVCIPPTGGATPARQILLQHHTPYICLEIDCKCIKITKYGHFFVDKQFFLF